MNRILGQIILAALLLGLTLPQLAAQQNIVDDSGPIDLNDVCHPGGVGQDDGCTLEGVSVIYSDTSPTNLHTLSETAVTLDSFDDGFYAYVCTEITQDNTQVLTSGCIGDDGQGVAGLVGNIPISLTGGPYSYAVDTTHYYDYLPDGGCESAGTCLAIVNTSVDVTLGRPEITSVSPRYVFVGTSGTLTIGGESLSNPFGGSSPTVSAVPGSAGGNGLTISGTLGDAGGTASYNATLTATTGGWDLGLSTEIGITFIANTFSGLLTVGDPTPSITLLSLNAWNAGQTNLSVTITGSGFGSNPQLSITGNGITGYSIHSHTDNGSPGGAQIVASVSISTCAPDGSAIITVTSEGYNGTGFVPAYTGQSSSGRTTASISGIAAATVSLTRKSLMGVEATGSPNGGSFSYAVSSITGTSLAGIMFASGVTSTTNPNTTDLTDPNNPNQNGSPSPGGLAQIAATYAMCTSARHTFQVPTFGMSCYYTTLQSDWGTVPKNCASITINGVTYSGTITNPYGLTGTYCSSFIAEVKLQGSGVLTGGQDIQYDPSTNKITKVSAIKGADGTSVVANKTVARDRSIIPTGGVHVDIDRVGTGLLANDTGGAIKGYRIDLYKGAGKTVCTGYNNIISVSACNPGNSKCPASTIQ